jgi:uncharacterized membrane protein YfcA
VSPVDLAAASAVMVVASAVQGAAGFGVALIAAPILTLIDKDLVPGPIIAAAVVLNILVARRERAEVDHDGLRWAVLGVIPGTAVGALALDAVPTERLGAFFGGLVLVGVALTASGVHLPARPGTLLSVGVVSGFMGTASSIGGPPIALIYQRSSGPRIRSTLARYFLVSGLFSMVALTAVGHFRVTQVVAGIALLPGLVSGFRVSRPVARVLDRGHLRTAVLILCTATAIAVLLRTFA